MSVYTRSKILWAMLITYSCTQQSPSVFELSSPMDRLPANKAGEVVRKAIDRAGGWDNWSVKDNFSFYKKITQLDTNGVTLSTVRQLHQYNMRPGFQARMSWRVKEHDYLIINNGIEARKYVNGQWLQDQSARDEAWNSSYGSNYVVCMPFKLTDPGVTLIYEGIDSATIARPVHAVRVEYAKGAGSTGGMHLWWYYFEPTTYELAANFLDYGEGFSLTTYESFTQVDDMRMHNRRFSYVSNANKEKVWLKTIYENEEMQFDVTMPDKLFQLN